MNKLMRIVAVAAILLLNSETIFAQEKGQSTAKPRGLAEFRAGTAVGGFLIGDRANINYYSRRSFPDL